MDRRVTPPKRVITSPTWGPPPPCKQALRFDEILPRSLSSRIDLSGRNICHLARPDLRDITNLVEFLARSLYPAQMFFISARSRRDLREMTNLAEISSKLTRSRRDLCNLGEISLISRRSRRDLVEISATIQIPPRSRRDLTCHAISPRLPRSR